MRKKLVDWKLRRFQWSFFLLTVGFRCNQLAVAWWALKETGSASLFSAIIACTIGVEVLSKPLFGWLGDRYLKMKVILLCNTLSMVGAASLFVFSLVSNFLPIGVTISMMLHGIAMGIRDPIQSSIIPELTSTGKALSAFNRKALLSSAAMLIGPTIAGLLVSYFGVSQTLCVDLILIIFSLLMFLSISLHEESTSHSRNEQKLNLSTSPWYLIHSGFKIVFKVKMEFYLAIFSMLVNLILFPFFTIMVPYYVQEIINFPAWYIGLLDCAFGFGILCATKLLNLLLNYQVFRDFILMIGFSLLGLNLLAFGFGLSYFILPVFFILGGVGLIFINVNTSTVRTLATPSVFRNRMVATVSFFSSLASPIGSLIIGFAISHYGVSTTSQVTGLCILTSALGVAVVPNIRLFMRMPEDKLHGAYGQIYPAAFQ